MKRKWMAGAFLIGSALMTACAGGAAVVVEGPPPPRYGVVGVAPRPGYVWVEGFWDLRGSRWEWAQGHWMRPPRARAAWVAPEWRHEGSRWRFHKGYWR
jgi:hypothetical protein